MLLVKKFLTGAIGTNSYILMNSITKKAVIVDPCDCSESMQACIQKEELQIEAVLLTHGHFDHIMGLDKVLDLYGDMPIYIHRDEIEMLRDPGKNLSVSFGMQYAFQGAVTGVRDGEVLNLIGFAFRVIHTPGHTIGGVCYYVEEEEVLISGDTLFQESVGRTDFPGGSTLEIIRSIKEKLFQLPLNTQVFPGHMGTTTIWHEKERNPFIR